MTGNFEVKFNLYKKWNNIVVLPISLVLLLVALFFGGAWLYTIALLLLLSALAVNCLWFVPTGYVGYKTRFTKLVNKACHDGINFLIPFIEEGNLLDTRVITNPMTDTKKTLPRLDVNLDYVWSHQINPKYAPQIFRTWGVNYFEDHISKWIDATLDTFINQLTYEQLMTQKKQIEEIASALAFAEVDKQSSLVSKNLGSHEAQRCDFTADTVEAFTLAEDGTTVKAPKLELNTWTELTEGVNFFNFFILKINKITFEQKYEEARSKWAVEKVNVATAEQQQKSALILADTKKQVEIKAAEARAKAIDMEGEALRRNPEYTAQTRAEHMPSTIAGDGAVSVLVGGGK